jgi:hypothetical protein
MTYRYEIDENNAIHMWVDTQEQPFLFQPDYPDGTTWADRNDAEAWAKAKIDELSNIENPMAPDFPNQEPRKQPAKIEQEKAAQKAALWAKLGLTEDEAKLLLG